MPKNMATRVHRMSSERDSKVITCEDCRLFTALPSFETVVYGEKKDNYKMTFKFRATVVVLTSRGPFKHGTCISVPR